MRLRKLTIVGVGLLGGSIGLAARSRALAGHISGFVRRPAAVEECLALGVVDSATCSLAEAVEDADLVVLCSPLSQMRQLMVDMLPRLEPDVIVTDVGSVKGTVIDELEPLAVDAGVRFVGSHPMAGSEKTGPAAARQDLFKDAVCVVTPTPRSNSDAVTLVQDFWTRLGARTLRLSPRQHDDLVSRSSHLPHVVSAALANYVLSPVHPPEQAALCAGGFRDMSRIAAGSPALWRDIAMANRHHLARVLGVFMEDLAEFRRSLADGNASEIEEFFAKAKERRDSWHTPEKSGLKGE